MVAAREIRRGDLRRGICVVFCVLCAASVQGCSPSGSTVSPPGTNLPAPTPPPPPVDPARLGELVDAYATRKRLRLDGSSDERVLNRHHVYFVRRRIQALGGQDASWIAPANSARLDTRIDSEVAEVMAYLTAKLGTTAAPGPLGGGTDATPAHLDLADVAKVKTHTPASAAAARSRRYLRLRKARVRVIVWRACAVHPELWQAAGGGATGTLLRPPLDVELDRRLRVLERMSFQISSAAALIDRALPSEALTFRTGHNPSGPWFDDFRVRIFEYPRLPASLASAVGAANIAEYDVQGPSQPWQWESAAHARLHYTVGGWPGIRFAAPAAGDWQLPAPGDYSRRLVPPDHSLAQGLSRLFQQQENWWDRSWLFCDHVVSALHLEGLRHGLRRREGSDARFDQIANTPSIGPVLIGALLSSSPHPGTPPYLIAGQNEDPYFQQILIFEEDLQAGDHVIIWNSWLYSMVGRGEWRLENSIVMDVDHDPATGLLKRERLALQGHGIGQKHYPDYQDEIAQQTNLGMREAQTAADAAPAATNALTWRDLAARLVRWEPYDSFTGHGAWWIRIEVPDPDSLHRWSNIAEALHAMPGAVSDAMASGAPGYRPPPRVDHVYFPLFAPHMRDPNPPHRDLGWTEWLRRRRLGPDASLPRSLHPVQIDGTMMPGLFFRGQGTPFAVIRPRIVP
jgi:hypothetical protein